MLHFPMRLKGASDYPMQYEHDGVRGQICVKGYETFVHHVYST